MLGLLITEGKVNQGKGTLSNSNFFHIPSLNPEYYPVE